MEAQKPVRALFLDRDGVVNEELGYLFHQEDVRFVPGIVSLCKTSRSLGYRIFIVTNQAGIGRGYYTEAEFERLMAWMQAELAREEVRIDGVYFCPFHPEHGLGEYRREHEDRKPGTGMLRRAAADFGVSLADSVMVGDRCTDIATANAAGLKQAFLLVGTEANCEGQYLAVGSLAEVEAWLLLAEV